MFLYTNLFTVEGQDPAQNRYVDMFWIWLRYVQKYGYLQAEDTVVVLMDTETAAFVQKTYDLLPLQIQFTVCTYPPPKTVLEGILQRYTLYQKLSIKPEDTVMHLDVDILCIQNPTQFFIPENTFYVVPEGDITDSLYLGDLLTDEDRTIINSKEYTYGLTAGLFFGRNCESIFTAILKIASLDTVSHYSLDQPAFNRVLFDCLHWNCFPTVSVKVVNPCIVRTNEVKRDCDDKVVFLNMCGEPGNGPLHWIKMFAALLDDD
jgi:hypothetical protein